MLRRIEFAQLFGRLEGVFWMCNCRSFVVVVLQVRKQIEKRWMHVKHGHFFSCDFWGGEPNHRPCLGVVGCFNHPNTTNQPNQEITNGSTRLNDVTRWIRTYLPALQVWGRDWCKVKEFLACHITSQSVLSRIHQSELLGWEMSSARSCLPENDGRMDGGTVPASDARAAVRSIHVVSYM